MPDKKLRYLTLKLTNKCNLDCKMCGQVYAKNRNNRELSLDLIKKCLHELDTIEHVYLFGGEPLLHSHFAELLEFIQEKNIPALATTNGMLLDRYMEKIVRSGLRDIDISIDSHKSEIYKSIRINGDLHKVLSNLDLLFRFKETYGFSYPKVGISCVILPDNCRELIEFYDFFTGRYPLLDRITFEFPMSIHTSLGKRTNQIYSHLFDCTCDTWRLFCDRIPCFTQEELDRIKKQIAFLSFCDKVYVSGEGYAESGKGMDGVAGNRKCEYPFFTLTILENGHATFCTDFPDVIIGDLNKEPIQNIWGGERAGRFRAYMDERGLFPICKSCCHYGETIKQQKELK